MKRLAASLLFVMFIATPVLLTAGCDYYRIDPNTGKRYEITRQQYKEGLHKNEQNASYPSP